MKPVGFVSKEWTGLFGNEEFPTKILWSKKDGNCDIPMIELTPALQELVEAAINLDSVKGRHHSQIAMDRLSKAAKAFNEAGK